MRLARLALALVFLAAPAVALDAGDRSFAPAESAPS